MFLSAHIIKDTCEVNKRKSVSCTWCFSINMRPLLLPFKFFKFAKLSLFTDNNITSPFTLQATFSSSLINIPMTDYSWSNKTTILFHHWSHKIHPVTSTWKLKILQLNFIVSYHIMLNCVVEGLVWKVLSSYILWNIFYHITFPCITLRHA